VSIQQLLNGVSLGSVYALIAVGFALVFNILKFSNFAHGGVMTVTAYIGLVAALFFSKWLGGLSLFAATLFSAAVAGALVGIVLERMAFRRIRNNNSPVIYYFISSITMGILMENCVTIFASSTFYSYPRFFEMSVIELFHVSIALTDLLMLVFSSTALMLLLWVLYHTKIGLAIRALSFDVNTANLMGMDSNRVVMATFIAAGILGGVAGVFLGINYTLYPQLGQLIVKGFIASVIGGLGSITGAMIGAVLLGVLEVTLIGIVGAGLAPVFVFIVMLVFLLIRPRGISGVIVQEKA
jgi:branched-chain amino acid transport system permease protein